MVAGWIAAMEIIYPGIVNDQLLVGSLFLVAKTQIAGSLAESLGAFAHTVLFNPPQLAASCVLLVFFPVAMVNSRWRPAIGSALYLTGILGIAGIALVRPSAYTYLGATQMLLLPCFGPAISRFLTRRESHVRRAIGLVALSCCVVVTYRDVGRLCLMTQTLPNHQQPDAVFSHLKQTIPAGQPVVVTPRHWYAFQGRNPWREAYLSSRNDAHEVVSCEWLVLYPGVGTPYFIDAFEPVEQVVSEAQPDNTYAYSTWKSPASNQNCAQLSK
jgi:hypothetical protein